jgi:hypothetical protein
LKPVFHSALANEHFAKIGISGVNRNGWHVHGRMLATGAPGMQAPEVVLAKAP